MKVALVTGGTSGIGKEIACMFLKAGITVFVTFLSNEQRAQEAKNIFDKIEKGKAVLIKADVTNESVMQEVFKSIEKQCGHLDFLINNAGGDIMSDIENLKLENFMHDINLHLTGKVIAIKYAIPLLKKSKTPRIINIASRLGTKPMEDSVGYCCAEAGVVMLTKVAALELSKYEIRVNAVSPAMTDTPFARRSYSSQEMENYINKNPLKRMGKTSDVANTVKFLISDDAEFITGENINVSGGILLL